MIRNISSRDARYPIGHGHGSDAIHRDPVYSYAVTQLHDDNGLTGVGLAFTLGEGNQLVCEAAKFYAQRLVGKRLKRSCRIRRIQHGMADEQQFRWLGPHKGVVQLALASVTNACWDLWAKSRACRCGNCSSTSRPNRLSPRWIFPISKMNSRRPSRSILFGTSAHRSSRENILKSGYPGYDTSVGWFNYDDDQIRENCRHAVAAVYRDEIKSRLARSRTRFAPRENRPRSRGRQVRVMVDANQQWTLPQALDICRRLRAVNPFWIEEPTHPDDVLGHKTLADAIAPVKLALGEHVPNRVVFKNYLQASAPDSFKWTPCASPG